MKRKIIKLGTATMVASLPRKWVMQFGLKQGDYLDVEERGKALLFRTERELAVSEKQLDCRKLNTRLADEYLIAAYLVGYDTIEVLHEPFIKEYKTDRKIRTSEFMEKKISQLFGMEIIEQSETRTVIKQLAEATSEEINNMIRRIFYLIKEMGVTMLDAIKKNDRAALEGQIARYSNNRKLLLYFQRILNKQGYTDFAKTNFMFIVSENISIINGTFRIMADYALGKKTAFSRKGLDAFGLVNAMIAKYVEFFFKYNQESILDLIQCREQLEKLVFTCKTPDDSFLISELRIATAHLMHCIRARFGMEL